MKRCKSLVVWERAKKTYLTARLTGGRPDFQFQIDMNDTFVQEAVAVGRKRRLIPESLEARIQRLDWIC